INCYGKRTDFQAAILYCEVPAQSAVDISICPGWRGFGCYPKKGIVKKWANGKISKNVSNKFFENKDPVLIHNQPEEIR
ncbi:MAG: hypothetical protein ACOCW2_05090, partial [Chitinivibrionales bacterium]